MNKLIHNKKMSTLVGLLLSLFGITFFGWLVKGLNLFTNSYLGKLMFSDLRKWILAGVIILIVLFWENRNLSSIGIKKLSIKTGFQAILFGIVAVILGVLTLGLFYNVLGLKEPSELSRVSELPLIVKLLTITTAAITEEILYRGYSIERIKDLSGSITLGGLISGFIFLAIHYPGWGLSGAIPQIIFSIFLIGFYIKKRNLTACIVMHWIINFLMIIVLPPLV